jgi:hypothetical protein
VGTITMIAQALLVSLIPLLPVSEAIDAQDPGAPVQPTREEAPAAPRPMIPAAAPPAVEGDRRSAVYLAGGFGTPLGFLGIEGVRRIGSTFEITGGLGIGYGAAKAEPHAGVGQWLQWAVMPRLRFGDGGGAVTVGAGVSGGNYTLRPFSFFSIDPQPPAPPISYYLWSNFEIGGEWWLSGGFALRLFGGYAHGWCVSGTCYSPPQDLPYTGVGLGYAF